MCSLPIGLTFVDSTICRVPNKLIHVDTGNDSRWKQRRCGCERIEFTFPAAARRLPRLTTLPAEAICNRRDAACIVSSMREGGRRDNLRAANSMCLPCAFALDLPRAGGGCEGERVQTRTGGMGCWSRPAYLHCGKLRGWSVQPLLSELCQRQRFRDAERCDHVGLTLIA